MKAKLLALVFFGLLIATTVYAGQTCTDNVLELAVVASNVGLGQNILFETGFNGGCYFQYCNLYNYTTPENLQQAVGILNSALVTGKTVTVQWYTYNGGCTSFLQSPPPDAIYLNPQ